MSETLIYYKSWSYLRIFISFMITLNNILNILLFTLSGVSNHIDNDAAVHG